MGFDSPCVERVLRAKPPRNLSDYWQEIGRAGRRGQQSTAMLHFGPADIASNVKGIKDDIVRYCRSEAQCLREIVLDTFGFTKELSSEASCKYCQVCSDRCQCEECKTARVRWNNNHKLTQKA